ncbi:hypothetical protein CY34DRAFT_814161, partial [Suillus luteus UH-Slu-Lm8-n1]
MVNPKSTPNDKRQEKQMSSSHTVGRFWSEMRTIAMSKSTTDMLKRMIGAAKPRRCQNTIQLL